MAREAELQRSRSQAVETVKVLEPVYDLFEPIYTNGVSTTE
jgi:hypothetical protein